MTNFEYYSPTKVIFGKGVISGIGNEAVPYGKKALLLYGKQSLKTSGLYDLIMDKLTEAGIQVVELGGVEPNPVLPHALKGIELAKKESVDFIIAAGGGSVIDEAKGIAAGMYGEADLWDYYSGVETVKKALPIIAVQTQPATSSETNSIGVLTNPERGEKFGLSSSHLVPVVAFLDPEVTFTIPLKYTSYACFDIMCHMLEGYFTTTAAYSPIQDGFVEGLTKGVKESLIRVLKTPDDYEARAAIMWAGALAWNGLANSGLEGAATPNHMLEHPMSGLYNVAHGAGLAVAMPAWLKFKKKEISDRILRFGEKILEMEGLYDGDKDSACDKVIARFEEFIRSIGCPLNFTELGIKDPDFEELTRHVQILSKLWDIPGYSDEDIKAIFSLCI